MAGILGSSDTIQVFEEPYNIEVADILNYVDPSITLALNAKKQKLLAKGVKIIGFTAGELSEPLQPHVAQAMIDAILLSMDPDPEKRKLFQYTPVGGTPELKKAILAKLEKENHLVYNDKEIIATAGAKEALAEALRVLVKRGQKVLIGTPAWVSYQAMVRLADGEPILVETGPKTFKWTPALLKAALKKDEDIKCLIINSPSNPSGAVYTREELQGLANVLKEFPDVVVVSDDIYEHIRYDVTEEFATMAQIDGMKDRTVTINGGSKAHAMTGLRIGYAAGPAEVIKGMETIQGHGSGNPSVPAQIALTAALDPTKQEFINDRRTYLRKNRDMVVAKLNDMGLECETPDGAFYAYPSCKNLFGMETNEGKILTDAASVAEYFLERGVLVVPGDDFGNKDRLRLSFASDYRYMEEGLDYMAKAVEDLSPGKNFDFKRNSSQVSKKDSGKIPSATLQHVSHG